MSAMHLVAFVSLKLASPFNMSKDATPVRDLEHKLAKCSNNVNVPNS